MPILRSFCIHRQGGVDVIFALARYTPHSPSPDHHVSERRVRLRFAKPRCTKQRCSGTRRIRTIRTCVRSGCAKIEGNNSTQGSNSARLSENPNRHETVNKTESNDHEDRSRWTASHRCQSARNSASRSLPFSHRLTRRSRRAARAIHRPPLAKLETLPLPLGEGRGEGAGHLLSMYGVPCPRLGVVRRGHAIGSITVKTCSRSL